MGKVMETKFRDVSHKIIKKPLKKEKANKNIALIIKPQCDEVSLSCILPMDDNEEPSKCPVSFKEIALPQSVFNKLEFEVIQGTTGDDVRLQAKGIDKMDLFFQDELTSSYVNYINKDLGFCIVDEISLEGLDGITIEAYWKRLTAHLEQPLNNDIKEAIWRLICKKKDIEFYKLPEPRGVLEIYDRLKNINTHIGVVLELAYKPPDIYPHNLINHPEIQGSCTTFNTRVDISSEVRPLALKHAEQKYDRSLAIVASQKLRTNALCYETSDPKVEHQNMEYCVLERIGRSRKFGELTQGNLSIASHFQMDAKSVYHYKKQLIQSNLLAKQFFYIKSPVTEQNKTGRLLHLRRFFQKMKPKQLLVAEQIVNVMKSKPHHTIEYSEVRKLFQDNEQSVKKIIKSPEFHKFVKTDCLYPYRELYPNAKKSEYMRKSKPAEKYLKCLKLIDPYVNLSATWTNDQDDSDIDDEEGEEDEMGAKIFNMGCVREVFHHILSKGKKGVTVQELQKLVGVDNNTIRMVVKKLLARNVVNIERFDKGKQRHHLYYARCLENEDGIPRQNPDPPKPPNNVLAKMKQRQREAIEKTKLVAEKDENLSESTIKFPRIIEIETPDLKCDYFTTDIIKSTAAADLYIQATFTGTSRENMIKLYAELFDTQQLFNINTVLSEIQSNPSQNFEHIANFTVTYTKKPDTNYMTKLILLKATFGEAKINADTLHCFSRKRKLSGEIQVPRLLDEEQVEKQKTTGRSKLDFMGDSPLVIFREKEDDVNVEIIQSTAPAEFITDNSAYPKTRELSERVMSRIQIILGLVQEKRIVEDTWTLIKHIQETERKDGYTKKIDRKSLARILCRLVEGGYLKIFKLVMWDSSITKTLNFICHPAVSHTDSLIQSASQQQRWKYFVGTMKKTVKPHLPSIQESLQKQVSESPFNQFDVMDSIAELKKMNKIKYTEIKSKYNRQSGRIYGFKPKFIRMRVIHEFLFYLIYEYSRDTKPLDKDEAAELLKSYRIGSDSEKIPPIFSKEISWKTFIPPLPYHEGWIDGWALVCDVILRLPIYVLCKVHNITYELPELLDVLKHPIKRFYLVKDLHESIRNTILFKRKYLFTIHESMTRLAYFGLLQFGPQKYKEKDQVFIYLNRRAALLDTTSSEPNYHKVSDKDYKQLQFFFNNSTDVESYWYNVYAICLSTKLNAKLSGQLITLYDPGTKPELMSAVKSKTPEQAVQDDNGETPGDRRGAGGFDSSLWSHIERNWFWADKKIKGHIAGTVGLRKERLEKILPQTLQYDELGSCNATSKVFLHKTTKEEKKSNPKKGKKRLPIPVKPSKAIQKITRKIPDRPKKIQMVTQCNDHLDKVIIKRIGINNRVRWSPQEDKILMLCKAASIFLNPRFPKKQAIPYTVLRDVLHRSCPESKNKTSRACQRRLKMHIMESNPHLIEYTPNLLRIKPISDCYSIFVNNLLTGKTGNDQTFKPKDSQLTAAFVILMSYIVQHKNEVESVLQGNLIMIDHLSDDGIINVELNAYELEKTRLKYQDVTTEDDIKRNVLKSVIHSALASDNEPGWTFQLLRIYQKYPDNLIREAVAELKHSQMISLKKFMKKKNMSRCYMPFHLSNVYVYSLGVTFNLITAAETYKAFLSIMRNDKSLDFSEQAILSNRYGQMLGLNEFCTIWDSVWFEFSVPQTTVILNPDITDHSELVDELAVRWQAKLKRMQENVEAEPEPEPDIDRSKPYEFDVPATKEPTATLQVASIDAVDDVPLDLTVDSGSVETINRLKSWVNNCMDTECERRSPSPEFVTLEECYDNENGTTQEREPAKKSEESFKTSMNMRRPEKDQIPTLEQIKEGMLESDTGDRTRMIPYITELSSLLNREYFKECNTNERTIERLKNHFIMQFAVLEDFTAEKMGELKDFYMMDYLQNSLKHQKIWESLNKNVIVNDPEDASGALEALKHLGATDKDVALVNSIIEFVFARNALGASGTEIKKLFKHLEGKCALESILKALIESRIFLRTGTCTVTFVHYRFQSTWLIETFTLTQEEHKILEEETTKAEKVLQNIDERLEEKKLIRIQVAPWIKIDGTLNANSFKLLLCKVLSHCMDHPKISLMKLCEKFCFLMPVDIYFLLEILEEVGCLEICLYDTKEKTLFSSWEVVQESHATFLDDFEDMYVEVSNVAMTLLGSFTYDIQAE